MKTMKKISKKGPLTGAQRQARHRKKMESMGYVRKTIWVKKLDVSNEAGNCK